MFGAMQHFGTAEDHWVFQTPLKCKVYRYLGGYPTYSHLGTTVLDKPDILIPSTRGKTIAWVVVLTKECRPSPNHGTINATC